MLLEDQKINYNKSMSSKKAMKQAQKQAYARHRSNITNNSRFNSKKIKFSNKVNNKNK